MAILNVSSILSIIFIIDVVLILIIDIYWSSLRRWWLIDCIKFVKISLKLRIIHKGLISITVILLAVLIVITILTIVHIDICVDLISLNVWNTFLGRRWLVNCIEFVKIPLILRIVLYISITFVLLIIVSLLIVIIYKI